jgi:hypothetical protein
MEAGKILRMSQDKLISFLRWAILLFIILEFSRRVEHDLTVATGCQSSPFFAQQVADMKKGTEDYRAKHPEEVKRVGYRMAVVHWTVHGITAVILAGWIVRRSKGPEGMPKALQATATAPAS